MTKDITVTTSVLIDYKDKTVVSTLKATVAQNLTDAEFLLFIEHCKSTRLNPFKREVWAIKTKDKHGNERLQIMTGINGFLQIANDHPMYDGMTVEVDSDERPTKAICKVYRKDRKYPAEGVALLKEYGKNTPIWQQMPRVMLTKVAKSIALRESFPQQLNGLYTQEEMPAEYAEPIAVPASQIVEVEAEYHYDLSKLEPEKHPIAIELLDAAEATMNELNIWTTTKPIKKLQRAIMTSEEVLKMQSALKNMPS